MSRPTSPVGALVVHGMGRQEAGFSDGLREAVSVRLGGDAGRVVWQEVLWAPVLEPRETALWHAMSRAVNPDGVPIRLDLVGIRQFVLHSFGDATAYQRDAHPESAGVLVHQRISKGIEALQGAWGDAVAPVVVLAHSLGGHMMSNYIWDRQHARPTAWGEPLAPLPSLAGMVTFGCSIPLFALAFRDAKPIDLPGEAITKPAVIDAARWFNFLDQDDVLGWPLRPLYLKDFDALTDRQKQTAAKLEDHEIRVGGPLTGWNPAAHDNYWEDDDFATPVAEYFKTLIAALDA